MTQDLFQNFNNYHTYMLLYNSFIIYLSVWIDSLVEVWSSVIR